ncbi:unnamed protein product [Peniophora sp. CBMAI 1063]|nr:unnamed protein product [Peniophora sp. CBMAI 1063]
MGKSVFSVPIFFIVFRETLEAVIIVSVLLGLVEQIVLDHDKKFRTPIAEAPSPSAAEEKSAVAGPSTTATTAQEDDVESAFNKRRLIRKMRIQIFAGAGVGLFVALAVGAAFIAVWFTQAADLWSKSEELWEGIFSLIASLIILVMGVTMLKLDRAKAKWRVKLMHAFNKAEHADRTSVSSKWGLFILPFITVMREGLEAVVFVGGVALGQSATAIPLAAIIGLICGLIVGYFIYAFASRATLTVFLIVMTNFILLIGAGLFSRAVWDFQTNAFNHLLGADVDDAGGDGPGSYDVRGSVWHLDCCNPENNFDNGGWQVFNALFGWTNSATLGSVLGYVFYWIAAIVILIYLKFKEGRTRLFGYESAAGKARRIRMEERDRESTDGKASSEGEAGPGVSELPR